MTQNSLGPGVQHDSHAEGASTEKKIPSPNQRLALRMDDIGACSKAYEIYSHHSWGIGRWRVKADWLVVPKYTRRFGKWGPYTELCPADWHSILRSLEKHGASMTVAVTAAWVERSGSLTPFPEKYPRQAAILKEACESGAIEIANHGLTHCVLENRRFLPRLFSSNRLYHREFHDWLPRETHHEHIRRSQDILQAWLSTDVHTLVPPGNLFTDDTLEAAHDNGLRIVSCRTEPRHVAGIRIVGDEDVIPFHDREIVIGDPTWFEELLEQHSGVKLCTVRDLAESSTAI